MLATVTYPIFRLSGDTGLMVDLGDHVSPEINLKVLNATAAIELSGLKGVIEVIPSFSSFLIVYDPRRVFLSELKEFVSQACSTPQQYELPAPKVFDIPVMYGGEHGPDIEFVSEYSGLSFKQVVELHTAPLYQILMMGFTPGFPFLWGLDSSLAVPRLDTPRRLVRSGSVGIADNQTGIYPVDSPGGWRLIGRTTLKLFNPGDKNPFRYSVGDRLRFVDARA
jgi:inhibitor of KinA